jgi:uncharacterized membrane protein YhhN
VTAHLLAAASLAMLAPHLWAERAGFVPVRAASKTIGSLLFLGYALALGVWGIGSAGQALVVGLALSVVGDVLLLWTDKRVFLAGLVAFLLAHVAYIGAFLALGVAPIGVIGAFVVLGPVAVALWRWLGPHTGKLRPAVMAYLVVIGAMVCASFGSLSADPSVPRLAMAVAAVVFAASDVAVARQRFVKPGFENRLVGLPLYYVAQLVLAAAIGAAR